MKNTRALLPLLCTAALTLCLNEAVAQNTDGKATYNVQTTTSSGSYNPKNVAAVWVVDSTGKFVKTLCRHAGSRINYLAKWIADRGTYTGVDGVTSATLSAQPQTHTVTWDCKNVSGAVVADGTYTFRAEYTSANGQGPYCGTLCSFVKGTGSVATNYPNFANGGGAFQGMSLTYLPLAEIAVTNLTPSSGLVNSLIPVSVLVTNQTLNAATFSVAVSNLTAGTVIDTQTVTALAGRAATNMTFSWSTVGLGTGAYQIRAVASKLATETNTANNGFTRTITLSAPASSDIAVTRLAPADGPVNANVAMRIEVTNLMDTAVGSFLVALSNVTGSATLIASQAVASLEGRTSTSVALNWNTAGLTPGTCQLQACVGTFSNEVDRSNNTLTAPFVLRNAFHDLAVDRFSPLPMIPINTTADVTVVITNRGDFAETFTTALRDVTAAPVVIGTRVITNLAAYAGTTVAFAWNTSAFMPGYHTLQAGIAPVAGEADLSNNTNTLAAIIASGVTTNTLAAKDSVWRCLDKGLDISGAPWQTADYDDGFWASGPAPLGYGLAAIATPIGYGGVASSRYTTTYFRQAFTLDSVPVSVAGRVMRAHGVIIYLNGTEIARQNMPAGAAGYSTFANSILPDPAAGNYFTFPVPASALVVGRNLLAAELHLGNAAYPTAGFALELKAVVPALPASLAVAPSDLMPDGASQSGDTPGVSVTLSNTGNATASCLVLIKDAATGAVLGSLTAGPLVPGETAVVRVSLATYGAETGNRTLQALTVISGVTNLASIATAPFTLSAPDFTPQAVGAAGAIGGSCNAVAVNGRYVYLGCGATLEIWDALVPAAPVRKAALRLPGLIEDVAVGSNWVYAATGAAGVQFVDVSLPARPAHRSTFDSTGHARQLALANSLLYVADGLGGVRVLNVADPAAPVLAGAYQTAGPAQTVALASPHLLVLDSYNGAQLLAAANPAALAVAGTVSRVTAGLAAAVVNGAALVADANARLHRLDITTPSAPAVVADTLLPAAGRSLAASSSGSALYVAAGASGVFTLNAATLALNATTPVGGEAGDVAVAGNTLYVAAGFGGCRSFNITSALSPAPLAVFATGSRPVDAAAVGSKLFVAADESGFQVHSLQNPELPSLLATASSASNSRCVQISYPLAFVGDGLYGLKIYNIANAAAPALVGSYPAAALSQVRRIGLSGTRAVITDGRVLQLLSVANPAAPLLLATVTNTPGSFIFDVAAAGDHLYAACGGAGLRIYGLDSNLSLANTYATPGSATGLSCASNLLHVACGPDGWITLSIADSPASPVPVSASASGMAFGTAAVGPLLYLADGARAAQALNVSSPLTPAFITNSAALTRALRVRAASGLMVTAEDSAGLAIFNASPGDINLSGIPDAWEQQIVTASLATNGPIRSVMDVDPQAVGPNGYTYLQDYLLALSPTDPKASLNQPPVFTAYSPAASPAVISEGASVVFSVTAQDETGPTPAQRGLSNITWHVAGLLKQVTAPTTPQPLASAFTFKTDAATVQGMAFLDVAVKAVALDRMGSSTQRVWTVRVVNAPVSQTITFKPLPVMALGAAGVNPGATSTSLLPVLYTSSNEGVAQIVGGLLNIMGAGTAVLTASQPGNFDFKAATPVSQTLTVKAALTTEVLQGAGTVTGAGLYVAGTKVALLAKPAAGYTFLRWEDGSQAPARSLVMPSGNTTVSARFELTANVPQPVITNPGTQRAMVGVSFTLPLTIQSDSLPTVTVTGLPAGLGYNAALRAVTGVPSAAVTDKLVTLASKNVNAQPAAPQSFTMTVDPLPAWAQGSFSGWFSRITDFGPMSAVMTAQGKLTGKLTAASTNYAFSAASYDRRDGSDVFWLTCTAKAGSASIPLTLAVRNPASAVPPTLSVLDGWFSGSATGDPVAVMYRNVWKDAGMVTLITNRYTGYYTAVLPGGGEFGSGYLAFTADKAGGVKTAGKLADGSAVSLSGTLLLDETGRVFTVIYTAPTAYKGGCFAGVAELYRASPDVRMTVRPLDGAPFIWQNKAPAATQSYQTGFNRALGLDGGWYDTLGNLYAYYTNRSLSVGTEGAPVPALLVGASRYDSVRWDADGLSLRAVTNALGVMTGLAAPAATTPVKVGSTYDYSLSTNTVGLTVALTRATGVFKGAFKAWFDYVTTHTSKTIAYEGVLVPERADKLDGVAGRGYFLWADKSQYTNALNKVVQYPFTWSYDLKILLSE